MVQIGIAFAPGSATDALNVRSSNSARVYYVDAVTVFACARRWNPDADLFLGTTLRPPAYILDHLARLHVDVEIVPFAREPPKGLSNSFAASLYLLDILAMERCRKGVLIIDPDCAIVRTLPVMSETQIGAHLLNYTSTTLVNGLSAVQAEVLHSELLNGVNLSPFRHIGGEAVWVPGPLVESLLAFLTVALDYSISRRARGETPWFSTEEHLLGAAARFLPFEDLSIVRRIWTARSYRNATPADLDLSLWHLPAEKERGLVALQANIHYRQGWFWTAPPDEWIHRAGQILGITPSVWRRIENHICRRVRQHS